MADTTSETIFTSDAFSGPAERQFPEGTTYQEFVGREAAAGTFIEEKQKIKEGLPDQFIELGLEGGREDVQGTPIDLNTYFGVSLFRNDMEGQYDLAKEAYKREKEGTATSADILLLNKVRDPNGTVRKTFDSLAYGHPVLGEGSIDTGTFPKNSLTGEIEGLDVIPESIGESLVGLPLFTTPRDIARQRAEDGEVLMRYVRSQPDLQGAGVIQDAVVQAMEADMIDIVAERMYNLASASEEGVRHYLPRFGRWAEANTTGFGEAMTEEEIAQDLAQVRNSSFFANRQEVLNDMIRDQLIEMGFEEVLRKNGYLDKQEVDGVERYTKNFVSERFAEGFFEQVFDSKTLPGRIGMLMMENVGAYAVVKAPVQGTLNAVRFTRRHIDKLRGSPSAFRTADGLSVPQKFTIMTPKEQLVVATEYAALRGIPVQEAARQLAMMNKSPRFWNKWISNSIVDRVGAEANRQAVMAAGTASIDRIATLKGQLRNAQRRGNRDDILKFSEQLRSERAYSNWRKIKAANPTARMYGISPVFDTYMALTQAVARDQMGPIGEAVGAGAFLGVYGIKKGFDLWSGGFPVISPLASKMSFQAKVAVEDSFAFFLEFKGHAARGFAQGILVNPGLRGLMGAAPEELSKFLTPGQMSQLQRFSDNMFKGMTPMQRDAVIGSMDQGFQDVEKVLSGLEDFVPFETLRGLRQVLSLNLGQSTALNVFLALEHSNKLQHSGLSPKDVSKFSAKLRENLNFQTEAELQVGAMTATIEQLDRAILKAEEELMRPGPGRLVTVEDRRAREIALDSLRQLSASFKNAETYGRATLEKIIRHDKDAADRILAELTLESNEQFLQEAFLSGQIDELIEIYARYDRQAQEVVSVAPEGAKGPAATLGGDTPRLTMPETTPTELKAAGNQVDSALETLRRATKAAIDRNRVSASAEEVARTQNLTVVSLVQMAKAASKRQVKAAYDKIDEKVQIPLSVMGSDMLNFFKSYADEGQSFIKYIDPTRFRSFAGNAGKEFINSLNAAARKGLVNYVNDMLPSINRGVEEFGLNFATAHEYLNYVKRQIEIQDAEFMKSNGFDSFEDISDAQLTFYLIENPTFSKIDASAVRMSANAQELETLRQGANALIKTGSERQKQLGTLLRSEIDKAFDTWGQGANVELYNAVVVARKTHQLETQRFEKGTFGYKVDRAVGEQRVAEGGLEVGDTAKIGALIRPIVDHIVNPSADSAASVRGLMTDMMATFAPVTSTMSEQVLRMDSTGRYVLPTTEEIAETTSRVMDENSFKELQIIFDVAVRNAVFDKSNMSGLREAFELGRIPALNAEDMPKRIEAPAAYSDADNPLEAYFRDVQKDFTVTVVDDAGNTTQRVLFDMDDLIMMDRNIVDVVNAVPKYRQVHEDLVSVARTQREAIEGVAGLVEEGAEAGLKELGEKLPKFASGSGFLKNVIFDDDPRAFDLFLNRIRDGQKYVALTEDQKVSSFRALFTETLKEAGGYTRSSRPVTMFDGQKVPADNYESPQVVYMLLDDALTGGSDAGRKLGQLAEAAGVTEEQLETLHAVFRLSTQIEASSIVARQGDNRLTQLTKGFTLDNALSKAFNLARGMVSEQYVAAEVALRYAALAQGKSLNFLLQDSRAAGVVKNLLEDPTRVDVKDSEYFATALMKFIAGDLPATVFQVEVGSNEYAEQYWISQGLIFKPEPDIFEQAMP
jgi:hypothetical protein